MQSTTLCPKGLYKLTEDNDREVEENTPEEGEIVMPSTKEMSDPNMWVHYNASILKNGRLAHMDPEAPEEPPEDYGTSLN